MTIVHLTERNPQVSGDEMVAALVPPPQFDGASFETYRADPAYPSQQEAVSYTHLTLPTIYSV